MKSKLPDQALIDFAADVWTNQVELIKAAANHFPCSPGLVATIMLPVLFHAIAASQPDKQAMKKMVNEAIDKGFEDWTRSPSPCEVN